MNRTSIDSVVAAVATWIAREGVLRPGASAVVVGCSGGGDSSALLLALAACKVGPLHAVYVDHGLRPPAQTCAEAAIVTQVAAACGATSQVAPVVVARNGNRLAQARSARYQALIEAARAHQAGYLAVGHTATDQAETVAFRALRGDLRPALAGMPSRRVLVPAVAGHQAIELVRPLLGVERHATAAYVRSLGLPVADDPTNRRPELARTRIRQWLSAGRESAWLLELADTVAAEATLAREAAARLGDLSALDAAQVAAAEPATVLQLLRRAGLYRAGAAQVQALLELAATPRGHGFQRLTLGDGLVAERSYDQLRIGTPTPLDPGDWQQPVLAPGVYPWPWSLPCPGGAATVAVALACEGPLPGGLVLRNVWPGDRLRIRDGRRKLQDMLVDLKIPRLERRRLPLLAVGTEVLWLGAGNPDGRHAADPRAAMFTARCIAADGNSAGGVLTGLLPVQ